MATTILDAGLGLTSATDALDILGIDVGSPLQKAEPRGAIPYAAQCHFQANRPNHKGRSRSARYLAVLALSSCRCSWQMGLSASKSVRQKARDLGIVFTEEAAKSAAEFTDAMNELKQASNGLLFVVGAELAPTLTSLTQMVRRQTSQSSLASSQRSRTGLARSWAHS